MMNGQKRPLHARRQGEASMRAGRAGECCPLSVGVERGARGVGMRRGWMGGGQRGTSHRAQDVGDAELCIAEPVVAAQALEDGVVRLRAFWAEQRAVPRVMQEEHVQVALEAQRGEQEAVRKLPQRRAAGHAHAPPHCWAPALGVRV